MYTYKFHRLNLSRVVIRFEPDQTGVWIEPPYQFWFYVHTYKIGYHETKVRFLIRHYEMNKHFIM